jgi:putative endonuclease
MRSVYIVRCSDDTLYTGIAKDVEQRVWNHNNAKVWAKYTKSRRPVTLVRSKRKRDRANASKLELQIKAYPREKKEALIRKG